jgi:hypothetical protein
MEAARRMSPVKFVSMALLSVGLAAPGLLAAQSPPGSGEKTSAKEKEVPGLHDFDFLVGRWQVHHRKLKQRLANNHEWLEFEGTLVSQPLMGGYANVDDDVFEVPGGTYRGVAFLQREADPHTFRMVQDHPHVMSLGAGLLARCWRDVGDQLGAGPQTRAIAG